MSGVEGVGTRSVTDSSDTAGVAMPPPSARPQEEGHGVADFVEHVGLHVGLEAAAWAVEAGGAAGAMAGGHVDEARSRIVGFTAGSALLSAPIGA